MGAALGSDNTPQMLILSTVTGDNADRINGKYVSHTESFRSCPLFWNRDGRSWLHVQDTADDSHGRWEISIDPNQTNPEENYPPDGAELKAIAVSRHETTEYHSPLECRQWSIDNGNDDWSDQFLLWQVVFNNGQTPLVRNNGGAASSSANAASSAAAPFRAGGMPNPSRSFVQEDGSFDRSKLFETISRAISQVRQSRGDSDDESPASISSSRSRSRGAASSSSRARSTASSSPRSRNASSSATRTVKPQIGRDIAGMTVKGYVGPHSHAINGFYNKRDRKSYNDQPVFGHADPWLTTWLHANSDGGWRICIAMKLKDDCPSEGILYTPKTTVNPGACRAWHSLGPDGSEIKQPNVTVVEHNGAQFAKELQYWNKTYPFRLCTFVVKKPNGLIVSGAAGNEAHIINGHYERQGFMRHGAIQYTQLENKSCHLNRNPQGEWEFRFKQISKVEYAEDTCLCRSIVSPDPIPVSNPLYVRGWMDLDQNDQSGLKVEAYKEKRWKELKEQALKRLQTQRARSLSAAPRGIVVSGAIGPNADRINGRFGRDREPFNHSAVYVRVGRKRCWIRRSQKNNWVFGNYDHTKRSDNFGLARSVGSPGSNPVTTKRWEFETIGGWERKDDLSLLGLTERQWQALVREHQKFKRGMLSEDQAILRLRMQAELQRAAFVYSNYPEKIKMTHLTMADRSFFPLLFGRIREIPRLWEIVMGFYNPETSPLFINDDSYKLIVARERVGEQNNVLEKAHGQLASQTAEMEAMRSREASREARMAKMEAMLASLMQQKDK